jgi:hypothetical protein
MRARRAVHQSAAAMDGRPNDFVSPLELSASTAFSGNFTMEIVITVCALLAPGTCEDRHIGLDPEARLTLSTCMMQSMPIVAQWAGEHPNWVIKRWRCAERDSSEWPV